MNTPAKARKAGISRVSDAVTYALEQRILEGSLKPGDRVPPERELAKTMGVSRASLREAIQKLASKGMLASRQGEGTFVTDRLEAGFAEPWQEMVVTHPSVREDLLEFRHTLESKAAECAAVRAADADLERLEACLGRLEEAFLGSDLDLQVERDAAFHQAIADASHNVIIGQLTASLLRLMHDHIRLNLSELMRLPEARQKLCGQHRRVLDGIIVRSPGLAGEAAAAHIDFVRVSISEALRHDARRESALRRLGEGYEIGTAP
jgi:GntR family transcriptional regulator, transcriptional repressor for pyruvate dehydrogenase complex